MNPAALQPTLERRFFREPVSTASHLAGFVLSVILLPLMLIIAWGRIPHTVGAIAFGVSLIVLYAASTLMHGVIASRKVVDWLIKVDYIAIFLLIVGTYVPVCLVTLRGNVGWGLLAGELALAVTGIIVALLRRDEEKRWHLFHEIVRLSIYLVMGWLVILGAGALFRALPPAGLAWLIAGGVVYSVGAVIFALDRPHLIPGRFTAHDLWHFFVLGGSALHVAFVLQYILLPGSWLTSGS